MITTIIFDLGGVVISRGLWDFRSYLTKTYGVSNDETANVFIKKYYTPYFSGQMSETDFWTGVINDLGLKADWKELKQKLLDFYHPNDGMFELIDDLNKKGYKTCLLSDQTNDWWPYLDDKYKISKHFKNIIISSKLGFHKPDLRIYKYTLEQINSKPEECVYIDDLEQNLRPAEDLGMKTILYEDLNKLKGQLKLLNILD